MQIIVWQLHFVISEKQINDGLTEIPRTAYTSVVEAWKNCPPGYTVLGFEDVENEICKNI